MKKMILLLLVLLVLGSMPASAIVMCISQRGDERCHPTDGSEPPADCGWPGFWRGFRMEVRDLRAWLEDQWDIHRGGDPDGVDVD